VAQGLSDAAGDGKGSHAIGLGFQEQTRAQVRGSHLQSPGLCARRWVTQ
jgi:hypothetical protein